MCRSLQTDQPRQRSRKKEVKIVKQSQRLGSREGIERQCSFPLTYLASSSVCETSQTRSALRLFESLDSVCVFFLTCLGLVNAGGVGPLNERLEGLVVRLGAGASEAHLVEGCMKKYERP